MFTKAIASLLLITGLMQSSFYTTMPDRNIDNNLFVLNRSYLISGDYVPNINTISAHGVTRQVSDSIVEPLEELISAAKNDGIDIHIVSGYRSYKKQTNVFNKKMSKVKNIDKALDFVALPGASEHQLGTCVDLSYDNWQGLNQHFENTKQGKWLREHCYEHGFIVRYLPGYEKITGYLYEPWHLRYIGKDHSMQIKESNEIPLEFYVSKLRKEYYKKLLNYNKSILPIKEFDAN